MYDNTCKYLAEKSPASFVRWLLNTEPENIRVLKTEIIPEPLLEQVAQQVAMIEETEQRQNISACVFVLAGLRFEKNLIRQLFREDVMRESVTYQDILEQGVQQGMQRGIQRGEVEILQRLISRRFGELEPQLKDRIQRLAIPQLEDLGEVFLDFSDSADLAAWLQVHQAEESSTN